MSEFDRENRYFILKASDCERYLSRQEQDAILSTINEISIVRSFDGKLEMQCVVVEQDWPEYEPTWQAIQKRVEQENSGE